MKRAEIEILYVDDERANRVVFEHTVNTTFRVKTAETPSQALDLLDQHLCAVIVTDQRMPEMAGNELLAIVRERHPSIIRVVVTAYSDLDPILAAVNQGLVSRYIVKPWERQALLDVLRWAVDAWDVGLESASLQMRLLANERLAAIGALTSAVFHDMRQPLAMASTNAARLVQLKAALPALGAYLEKHPDAELGPRIKELIDDLPPAVDDILLGCEFVGSLADSVRALLQGSSRMTEPDTAPRNTVARAMSLCRDVVVMNAGAQLAYVGPATIPPVAIQSTDLLQVFVNLLMNAASSFEGVARLYRKVEIDAKVEAGKEVVFTVTDNGAGMTESVLQRVGTPFFTTRPTGTGLGTSQCLRLVKKAGGDLRFHSEVGGGTTVSVAVPVAEPVA
jgi:signal transduction histidine kinase